MSNQTNNLPEGYKSLFVTGCYRSGTTVLEKILHMHPNAVVASQPFPVLYFYIKNLFDQSHGVSQHYPLDHLFCQDQYRNSDLRKFLDTTILTSDQIDEFFDEMDAYTDGLWTPEMVQFRGRLKPGRFLDVYQQLNAFILELFPKKNVHYLGGKEILCEEYIPYLLENGVKVLHIIRDPRDMISSLNFRERDNLTGRNRPVLYSLRIWRKSVAFALACQDDPNFHWLRYEDLIVKPDEKLDEILNFLDLDKFPDGAFSDGIFDQWGRLWKGNSSFDDKIGLSTASIGKYRTTLPDEVIAFTETCCLPEMTALGYTPHLTASFDSQVLRSYRDPFAAIHDKFPGNYSSDRLRIDNEIKRYQMLTDGNDLCDMKADNWYISKEVFRKLRSIMSQYSGQNNE